MDRQHQYVLVDPSDHYGFLPHYAGEWGNPVAEEGIKLADSRWRLASVYLVFSGLFSLFG